MPITDFDDEPLPYPSLKHHTRWAVCKRSEEYLVPEEEKPKVFAELYPFLPILQFNTVVLDIHEQREFVVGVFKVVREFGMNMLVSPYYYNSGGSVIDWVPTTKSTLRAKPTGLVACTGMFGGEMVMQEVKPGHELRLQGLVHRQHEGRGL